MTVDALPQSSNFKQRILFDTNALQYLFSAKTKPSFEKAVLELDTEGYGRAISHISIFEAIKSTSINGAKQFEEKLNGSQTERPFKRYPLDLDTLMSSAILYNIYSLCDQTKPILNAISQPDLFIAATAILTDSLILTADCNHYPRPFFKEIEEIEINYRSKNHPKSIFVMLLEPNYMVIQSHIGNWTRTK